MVNFSRIPLLPAVRDKGYLAMTSYLFVATVYSQTRNLNCFHISTQRPRPEQAGKNNFIQDKNGRSFYFTLASKLGASRSPFPHWTIRPQQSHSPRFNRVEHDFRNSWSLCLGVVSSDYFLGSCPVVLVRHSPLTPLPLFEMIEERLQRLYVLDYIG